MKADLAQSDDLVACFNQSSADPVGTRERDTVAILASETPSSDDYLEMGKPCPQTFAEITCVRHSAP